MSIKKNIFAIILASASAATLSAQQTTVLDITTETPSASLILPESFETDTKAMLEDWYLSKYAVIDEQADSRPDAEVSDELLIERLSKLPTEIEMPLNSVVRNSIMFYANRRKQLVEPSTATTCRASCAIFPSSNPRSNPRPCRAPEPSGFGRLWRRRQADSALR